MDLALLPESELGSQSPLVPLAPAAPTDRAAVLVRAPIGDVVLALAPFADGSEPHDISRDLARGRGIDDMLEGSFSLLERRRAVVYERRGAGCVAVIREGGPGAAHDVPLARRLSNELRAPAIALRVDQGDVAFELFHRGRALESLLVIAGQVVVAESAFGLDAAAVERDPYGRLHDLLAAYSMSDDRLAFDDFAHGDLVLLRWDVTITRALAFERLDPWPRADMARELCV